MLEPGTIVAGYRLDGVLGAGGMGTVYRATQLSLNRVVALKLLARELSDDAGFRARFEREGQLQAGLDHENIVTVYEAGQTGQGLFLAMRLIDGPTLKQLITGGNLETRRALRILAQVGRALDEAHAAGLIHRDIKPQNILVGRGDHSYLADFGLIKAPDEANLTGTGQFLGTIDYVAPEQIQGDPATSATDCYALASVLYECLTGQVPFPRSDETGTLRAHIVESPPRPTEQRPELPLAVDTVIATGMAKDPHDRPGSATELIQSATAALAPAAGAAALHGPAGSASARSQSTRVPTAAATTAAATAPAAQRMPADVTKAAAPAAPTRASEPSAPSPATSTRGIALAVVLAVVAIVAGFLVGSAGKPSKASPLTNSATAGKLQLLYPSNWRLDSGHAGVPGITFSSGILLSATGQAGGNLAAGPVAGAVGPTLLPAAFRRRLASGTPAKQAVGLNGLEALRYTGLSVRGQPGVVSIYAVPTSAGAVLIACSTQATSSAFLSLCARVAATARLLGTRALALGPSAGYAGVLSAALSRLRTATAQPLATLATATSPSGQASAAAHLAESYSSAAAAADRVTVSSLDRAAHDRIISALRALGAGYARLASAARQGSSGAYTRARRRIDAGAPALSRALRRLSELGYQINAR